MTETEEIQKDPNNISKTYSEVAVEWMDEKYPADKSFDQEEMKEYIMEFAKYLDSMPNLMPHLELMVMKKAREIDREMMVMMIAEIPAERVKEIAQEVVERHKHTKTSIV